MLEFNGNDMMLTRGDTIYIDTVILTPLGMIYEVQEGDILKFTVYSDQSNQFGLGFEEKAVISKQFIDRKLRLDSKDTAYLSKGEYTYKCTIEMNNEDKTKETYCEGKFIIK